MSACGGSSSSTGTGPSTPPTTTPGPPPGGPTITITAAGVSPKQLEIAVGSRVTFTNNDTVPHEMASDPHPDHVDCPPLNEVSALTQGQSRQTGVFGSARTCGYHDHGQSTNTSLQGTIVIR
jgi:plastocyanin